MTTSGSLIHPIVSIVEHFDLERLFPKQQPLELELGAGDGSFLIQYAALHPEHNFIGVERLLGRIRKIDRKGRRLGLNNLRLVRLEALYVLQYLIPEKSLSAIHVYFPDPWPKRKHKRRRLINQQFAQVATGALKAEGVVFLRTDDTDYFAQMTEVFGANSSFEQIPIPESLCTVQTDFERGFLARGIETRRAAYKLRAF